LLALWENGIAYRAVWNAPLFVENGVMGVPEGLAAVDAAALASRPTFEDDRFVRWTEKSGGVELAAGRDGALRLTREGANLRAQDGGKWIRLAPVDGLRLDGLYIAAATAASPEIRIVFRQDGSFEMANLIHALGGPYNNPAFPMQGKGTYELRKWSLLLHFDGGYTQAIAFPWSGEGLADARTIIVGDSEFHKR
jgi:hypothetical protein